MWSPDNHQIVTGDDTVGGTYTLLVDVQEQVTVGVGALREVTFDPGWYAYTGSALGSGGFARLDRHRELAAGDRDTRHWHIDYLLGADAADIDAIVRSPGADIECGVASTVDGSAVPDFGCSDCDCRSHLVYAPQRAHLLGSVQRAHDSLAGSRQCPGCSD
jgi:endonuclease-3